MLLIRIEQRPEWWSLEIADPQTGELVFDYNGTLEEVLTWAKRIVGKVEDPDSLAYEFYNKPENLEPEPGPPTKRKEE